MINFFKTLFIACCIVLTFVTVPTEIISVSVFDADISERIYYIKPDVLYFRLTFEIMQDKLNFWQSIEFQLADSTLL